MKNKKKSDKVIIIGGGVGPMAGVELHKRIIINTLTNGTDQDHLDVYHLSRSHDIVDRTEQLLGQADGNAAEGMFRLIQVANEGLRKEKRDGAIGIPCYTFHAPPIFEHFSDLMAENKINLQIVNMIEETIHIITNMYPGKKNIGLMSSTGFRRLDIFNSASKMKIFNIIEVPLGMQNELHDCVYNKKWGIKSLNSVCSKVICNFEKYANVIIENGADIIILGCTEISLVFKESNFKGIPIVDPLTILARALIREVNSEKLKPI